MVPGTPSEQGERSVLISFHPHRGTIPTVQLYCNIPISHCGTPPLPLRKPFNALIGVLITLFFFFLPYHCFIRCVSHHLKYPFLLSGTSGFQKAAGCCPIFPLLLMRCRDGCLAKLCTQLTVSIATSTSLPSSGRFLNS